MEVNLKLHHFFTFVCTTIITLSSASAEIYDKEAIAIDLRAGNSTSYNEFTLTINEDLLTFSFTRLVHDFIFLEAKFNDHNISFIQSDMPHKEENLLEDILHFAYYNNAKVNFAFHLDCWKTKSLQDVDYLFKFFTTNCPDHDLCSYLQQNPLASILFTPKQDAGDLIKKNITAVVIGYNQLTYIKNMVSQLEKYTSDIIVIDNHSDFQPLLDYYANDYKYTLLRQPVNEGHSVYLSPHITKLMGRVFLLTDPDLQFNPDLPDNFIQTLISVSNAYQAAKVGFALLIDSDDIREDITYTPPMGNAPPHKIKEWEQQFWVNQLTYSGDPSLELYKAPVDTTFCLVNQVYLKNHIESKTRNYIRVAGNFTCKHLPWHKSFQKALAEGEYEAYLQNNRSSSWFEIKDPAEVPYVSGAS